MPYDQALAARIRKLLPRAVEKRMFGGIGLIERGHLIAGVSHNDLIVRVPPEETARWMAEPGAHGMMPGKPMKGWLKVASTVLADDDDLARWVKISRSAAKKLPPK